jgi:hypothetical protein
MGDLTDRRLADQPVAAPEILAGQPREFCAKCLVDHAASGQASVTFIGQVVPA